MMVEHDLQLAERELLLRDSESNRAARRAA
jgi:hypothetical protein